MNLLFLLAFTIFSTASFLAILFLTDPFSAGEGIVIMFFAMLFLSLAGAFSIIGVASSKLGGKKIEYAVSLRRGFLLAMLAISMVALQKFFVLNLGNAAALAILIVGVEMIFVYRSK